MGFDCERYFENHQAKWKKEEEDAAKAMGTSNQISPDLEPLRTRSRLEPRSISDPVGKTLQRKLSSKFNIKMDELLSPHAQPGMRGDAQAAFELKEYQSPSTRGFGHTG